MEIETFSQMAINLRSRLLKVAANTGGRETLKPKTSCKKLFLRMWAMRQKLDAHTNIEALAIKIIKGVAIDHWRHRKIECAESNRPKELVAELEQTDGKDDMELIQYIVDHLPPLQQQVFRLKEIDGYENEEIAKICNCKPEALRQNLSRARRYIQKEFIRLTTERRTYANRQY